MSTTTDATAEQLDTFAVTLWQPYDRIEVRIIHGRTRESRTLLYVDAAELAFRTGAMADANAKGWNVYAGLNPRDGDRRGDENVKCCRALFADREHADAAQAEVVREAAGLPEPTIIVNSGHGVHQYWKLAHAIEPAHWREVQRDLAALLGTDPKVHNPERIARLPGFLNTKDEPAVPCQLIECEGERVYDLADLSIPMRPGSDTVPPVYTVRRVTDHPDTGDAAARCRAYLAKCPNAISGDHGHDRTYAAACTCNRFGLSEPEAIELMNWYSATKCDPPWTPKEIAHKVASAYRKNAVEHGRKLREDRKRGAA